MPQVELDNRGLTPPEPMVRILSALSALGDDDVIVALMDREPLLLYPELERRGFEWAFAEAGEDYVLTIRQASP